MLRKSLRHNDTRDENRTRKAQGPRDFEFRDRLSENGSPIDGGRSTKASGTHWNGAIPSHNPADRLADRPDLLAELEAFALAAMLASTRRVPTW